MAPGRSAPRWLILVHQLPAKPAYLRVKVWRRLQAVGALPLKNSVYVLPNTDACREDLEWIAREVRDSGGDATLCEARLVDGMRDAEIEALFVAAREGDYEEVAKDARRCLEAARAGTRREPTAAALEQEVARLRRRLAAALQLDFFGAPGRESAEPLVAELEALGKGEPAKRAAPSRLRIEDLRGKTWVTRRGVHVDRIATAWLVRRFVDPEARFAFVASKGRAPSPDEIRFDMFEAELTHEGDLCTLEVLIGRLGLDDPALRAIAEIVHDIDLKESRYARPETAGVEHLLVGLAARSRDDDERLAHGAMLFDSLYGFFSRRGTGDRRGPDR